MKVDAPEAPSSPTKNASAQRLTSLFGLTASTISIAAIVLMPLGYGASLAIESFGMPHAAVYVSSFELIDLSSMPIASLINGGSVVLKDLLTLQLLIHDAWAILGGVAVFGLVSLVFYRLLQWRRLGSWLLRFGKTARVNGRLLARNATFKDFCILFVLPTLVIIGGWLFMLLIVMIPISLAVMVAVMPIAGYEVSKFYIREWVFKIDQCTLSVPAEMRLRNKETSVSKPHIRIANCVALYKDGALVSEGLQVATTSSAIILYNPLNHELRRDPTSGVAMLAIDRPQWFKKSNRTSGHDEE